MAGTLAYVVNEIERRGWKAPEELVETPHGKSLEEHWIVKCAGGLRNTCKPRYIGANGPKD